MYLLTYFTPSSSVSIVDFEHVNVSWGNPNIENLRKSSTLLRKHDTY